MATVVLVGLHLLRVFASGAFKQPREGNYLLGVLLAGMVAAFYFSGTVLKWDQEALEALEHNTEAGRLLGRLGFWFSPEFGGLPLLQRLYTVHIAVLPALFFLAVTVHLLLVKRHGMARSPFRHGPEPEPTEPFGRHLARLGGFGLLLVVPFSSTATLSVTRGAPAGGDPRRGDRGAGGRPDRVRRRDPGHHPPGGLIPVSRRPMLLFWSATAAAVFLLGGTVATLKNVLAGGSRANLALLAVSLAGLLGSLLAAGRIVVVVGRSIRADRTPTARH